MATPEQEAQARAQLEDALSKLTAINVRDLVRRDELGAALSFEGGVHHFERTLKLYRDLAACSLDGASFEVLNNLFNVARSTFQQFENIRQFSLEKYPQNAVDTRNGLINTVRDSYDGVYRILTPHIAYAIRKGTDFEALEKEARETTQEIRAAKEEALRVQKASEAEAREIVESIRRAAAQAGVEQHAIHFAQEASSHARAAMWWLGATAAMGVALAGFAGYSIWYYASHTVQLSTPQAIQLVVGKLFLFSVLYYALVWVGRNYRAHRHNFVVNKHRQNALSTFQAFAKASGDEATVNAVLLRATEAIFSPESTGYLTKEPEPPASSQILEIVRGVARKDG